MDGREPVPYIVHESVMARQERHIRRLWIMCIIIFLALIATNGAWIWYENQFEDIVIEQDADTDPLSTVMMNGSGTGDIYGTRQASDQGQGEEG